MSGSLVGPGAANATGDRLLVRGLWIQDCKALAEHPPGVPGRRERIASLIDRLDHLHLPNKRDLRIVLKTRAPALLEALLPRLPETAFYDQGAETRLLVKEVNLDILSLFIRAAPAAVATPLLQDLSFRGLQKDDADILRFAAETQGDDGLGLLEIDSMIHFCGPGHAPAVARRLTADVRSRLDDPDRAGWPVLRIRGDRSDLKALAGLIHVGYFDSPDLRSRLLDTPLVAASYCLPETYRLVQARIVPIFDRLRSAHGRLALKRLETGPLEELLGRRETDVFFGYRW